jgi:hypothetical protein
MHARVVTWEGADADAIRANAKEIDDRSGGGPPEGVPAIGIMVLTAPEDGKAMIITLFDSEADMRQGDAVLNEMSPGTPMGERSVGLYEVAIERRL